MSIEQIIAPKYVYGDLGDRQLKILRLLFKVNPDKTDYHFKYPLEQGLIAAAYDDKLARQLVKNPIRRYRQAVAEAEESITQKLLRLPNQKPDEVPPRLADFVLEVFHEPAFKHIPVEAFAAISQRQLPFEALPKIQVERSIQSISKSNWDPEDFAELYEILTPGLRRFAAGIVGEMYAEDIVQTAMLNLWLKGGQGYDLNQRKKWLGIAVRNGGIDFLRHQSKIPLVSLDQNITNGEVDERDVNMSYFLEDQNSPDPEDVAILNDNNQALYRQLRSLKKRDLNIILLRHFEEMPYQEIASKLGILENTLRTRFRRALDELRKLILEQTN